MTDLQATLSPLRSSTDPGPSGPLSTKPCGVAGHKVLGEEGADDEEEDDEDEDVRGSGVPNGSRRGCRGAMGYSGRRNSGLASIHSRNASPMVIQSPAPISRFCSFDDEDEENDEKNGFLKGLVQRDPGGDAPLLPLAKLCRRWTARTIPSAVDVDVDGDTLGEMDGDECIGVARGEGGDIPWFDALAAAVTIGIDDVGDVENDVGVFDDDIDVVINGDVDVGDVEEGSAVLDGGVVDINEESEGNCEFVVVVAAIRASMSAVVLCILSMCSLMFSNNPFFRNV